MRDYGKIAPQFWTGCTGRRIRAFGPHAQIVALYLVTCPSASMIGLYYLPLPTLAHETGIPLEGASKALRCLSEAGFAEYDEANEVVWVCEMARHQIGETVEKRDKRQLGIIREAQKVTYSSLFARWFARYQKPFGLPPMASTASPIEAPSKPLRSQEQEQEHAQEQPIPSPAPSAATPLPSQPTSPASATTPPALPIDLGDPTPPKAKPTPRKTSTPKPAKPPPPFNIGAAFEALATASDGRFAPGIDRDWTDGIRIAVAKRIRQYPDLAEWRLVGSWLLAGGDGYRESLGPSWAASNGLPDAMARAREWKAKGGDVIAARFTPAAPDPAADMWASAARKAGVAL